jgi:signal peptidase
VALLGLVITLLAGTAPTLVGFETFVVLSGSMEPALGVGDLAVVGAVRPGQLSMRDIISYRTPAQPNVVITHRLVGVSADETGRIMFETKGDANDSVDQVEIDSQAVLGRVFYAVPKIGYLVDFAKKPLGKAVLLGVPAVLLALDALVGWRAGRTASSGLTSAPNPISPGNPGITSGSRSAAEALTRRAWVAQRNGKLTEALALLDQAIPLDPTCEEAWLLKADCFESPAQRLTCLWEGLAANPDSVGLRAASDEAARLIEDSHAEPPASATAGAMRPVYDHGAR